ncbi:MAG TPA: cyclodeaminase/cyclohydrolase family protein [Candidatus Bathyarchaeia archaeon]|nr:cyclodeaminase/cyclohydrolase family protein [Candidatus Bathyarchaeia archaeon]
MIKDQKISSFLDDLSSKKPVPGGGSTSAVAGAMAASLVAMVANLTLGKEKYREVEEDFEQVLPRATQLKDQLLQLADEDALAYQAVVKTKSQEAIKTAAEVPLKVAQQSLEVLRLAVLAVKKGNQNALSDARCAIELATAAIYGALENIRINLPYIEDKKFVCQLKSEIKKILTGAEEGVEK